MVHACMHHLKLNSGNVQFQKISIPPPRMVFNFEPLHPYGNSSLASYFPVKILSIETPHPLGISSDHQWGGYGYFLEPTQ